MISMYDVWFRSVWLAKGVGRLEPSFGDETHIFPEDDDIV